MNSLNIIILLFLGLFLLIRQVDLVESDSNTTSSHSETNIPITSSASSTTTTTTPTTSQPTTTTAAPTTTPPTTSTEPPTTTALPTTTPSTTVSTSTTATPIATSIATSPRSTQTLPKSSNLPPQHIAKPNDGEQPRLIEALKQDKIDLDTENQRLKIAVGILTAIICVAVLFAVLIIYLRKRNQSEMGHTKSHRPNYFRPVSTFKSKTPPLDPALEYLRDDRLFVNDLDKEMETFKLNRGTNVMTSEL